MLQDDSASSLPQPIRPLSITTSCSWVGVDRTAPSMARQQRLNQALLQGGVVSQPHPHEEEDPQQAALREQLLERGLSHTSAAGRKVRRRPTRLSRV